MPKDDTTYVVDLYVRKTGKHFVQLKITAWYLQQVLQFGLTIGVIRGKTMTEDRKLTE